MKYLKKLKKYSPESLSDAMDYLKIKGCVRGFLPISSRKHIVGKAFTVKFSKNSNPEACTAGDYIDEVMPGHIIVIDNDGIDYCTVWGNILTQMAIIKNITGTVINGACRDQRAIKKLKYPLFSKFINCKTGKGIVKLESIKENITIDGVKIAHGDYIKVIDGILIVIPKEKVDDVLEIADKVNKMEQKILIAIGNGISLKDARHKFNYNKYK